jgi:hypothetical protein
MHPLHGRASRRLEEDIINDCNIITTSLKNGIDLFLSEDFHFTSKVTEDVLSEITSNACTEYHQMCDEELYCLDSTAFLRAYKRGKINMDVVRRTRKGVRKPGKRLGA